MFNSKVQIGTFLVCTGVTFGFDLHFWTDRTGSTGETSAEVKGDQTEENWTQIGKGRNYCHNSHQTPHVKKIGNKFLWSSFAALTALYLPLLGQSLTATLEFGLKYWLLRLETSAIWLEWKDKKNSVTQSNMESVFRSPFQMFWYKNSQ